MQNQTKDACPVEHKTEKDIYDYPLPPGNRGWPLVGETLHFLKSPATFTQTRMAQHGTIFYSNVLGANTVYMSGPEANQWILTGENKYLHNRWTYSIRQLLGGQFVAMLTGEAHRERRAQLSPHFKYQALRNFAPEIAALSQKYMASWAAQSDPITLFHEVRMLAFEIAVHLILGKEKVDIPYLSRQFLTWTAGMFTPVPVNLPFTTFGKAMKAKKALMDYLEPIVRRRQALAEQPFDMLGSLIETKDKNGQPLSRETILHEIQGQLFAGHDTTVTATSNLMLLLAQHPEALKKGREEQMEMADTSDLSPDTLKKMPYLNQLINEGLRVIPPVAGAFRVTTEDIVYSGYRIPKGWAVSLGIISAHQSPPWTNPDQFDPERWSPERAEHKQKPFAYIPFGGGPRLCLGQNFALIEMRIMLALLLRHYRWELLPDQDLTFSLFPFPQPKSGIQVHFSTL